MKFLRDMRMSFLRFVDEKQAVALIEFAFVLPVLLILFVGVVEIARYVIVNQKLDKASSQITNFIAQTPYPHEKDTYASHLNSSFKTLMDPYDAEKEGGYAVTGFGRVTPDGPIKIDFQHKYGQITSKIGSPEATVSEAALKGLKLNNRDYVIAVEVSFTHNTVLDTVAFISQALDIDGKLLRKTTFHRYRFDAEREVPEGRSQAMVGLPQCCGYYCNPIRVGGFNAASLERGEKDLGCACYHKPEHLVDFFNSAKNGHTCDRGVADAFSQCKLMTACEACSWSPCCGSCGCPSSRPCLPSNPDCHAACPPPPPPPSSSGGSSSSSGSSTSSSSGGTGSSSGGTGSSSGGTGSSSGGTGSSSGGTGSSSGGTGSSSGGTGSSSGGGSGAGPGS